MHRQTERMREKPSNYDTRLRRLSRYERSLMNQSRCRLHERRALYTGVNGPAGGRAAELLNYLRDCGMCFQ